MSPIFVCKLSAKIKSKKTRMKFLFETMRFLSKYIALNQQIIYLMTFHTYFTAFQTYAPKRIT